MLIDVIRRARVAGIDGLVDLELAGGRVASISPHARGRGFDAAGRVVTASFVDAHVHLDKAFHLEALGADVGGVHDAIALTAALQRDGRICDAPAAAATLLASMVRHGTTAARVHVEIGAASGVEPVRWHQALADEWADRIALQLVAFPQHGLFGDPSLPGLVEEAVRLGCDVVGACPYADDDQARHVDLAFELADRLGTPLDLHLDFSADPAVRYVDDVIDQTVRRGWHGRVVAGHVTSLGCMPEADRRTRVQALARAGIAIVSLPATDLFLSGALAPLQELRDAGVPVAVATNNVQNAFTPFGRGDLLQIAWLAGIAGRLGPSILETITTVPAGILGLGRWDAGIGAPADLVVHDTEEPSAVVAGPSRVDATIRRGRVVWCSER